MIKEIRKKIRKMFYRKLRLTRIKEYENIIKEKEDKIELFKEYIRQNGIEELKRKHTVEIEKCKIQIKDYKEVAKKKKEKYDVLLEKNKKLSKYNLELRQLAGANEEKIVAYEEKIAELEKQLKESMTDKYLVKKIPSGRTPNKNKTKISKGMSATVRKFMKDNFD